MTNTLFRTFRTAPCEWLKKSYKLMTGNYQQIAVVTGANSGFGFEIAKKLSENHIKVVLACRSAERALQAKAQIENAVPDADLDFIPLDLGSIKSVCEFAEIFGKKYGKINILVNNAGILYVPHKVTEDGFEHIFQTNYLGHFLLANLLLPFFPDEKTSKIVTQSSVMYRFGKIFFDDVNLTKKYSKWIAYSQSKFAGTVFALELQRRLEERGSNIQSVLAHPGISMATNILKNKIVKTLAVKLCSFFSHSADKGAMPAVTAALSDNIKGGDFVGLDGFLQGKGNPVKINILPKATDKNTAEKLWQISEKFVDKKFK